VGTLDEVTEYDYEQAAARVMDLETKLASYHWDVVKNRDQVLIYNPMPWADLVKSGPAFDWQAWIEALGGSPEKLDTVVVMQPDFINGFSRLWTSEPFATWKLWAAFHLISAAAPYLTEEMVEANFDFYGRTLSGTPEVRERWKRGVAAVEGALSEAVGEVYVAKYFPPEHKAKMDQLVANLVTAYRESINNLEWMGSETKKRAIEKLENFNPKIGYPVKWKDYSALEISPTDLLGNMGRSHALESDRELAKLGKPIDRDEWFMPPQMVNAYYNPGMNEIVFPAAILQPPFFDANANDAVNYGGIGAVIGHEIGHGFDDQGSKYDGFGRLVDWWTAADREAFEARTKALIAQYDKYVPEQLLPDGPNVNGALTIGENIGDLGGLGISIKAYAISLAMKAGHPHPTLAEQEEALANAPVIDGFTGLQRVFIGWALAWQTKGRDEVMVLRLATDPHSPAEFRCNGVVRNLDSFYEAFNVSEEDALYLPPAERVKIW
jgi:putative endopeptidase